jgi:hypothetical protein
MDKAGIEHVLLINVKRVSIKGGTTLFSCRDITDLRRAEQVFRSSGRVQDFLNSHRLIAVAKNNVRFLVIPAEAGIHPASRGTGPRIESGVTPRDAGWFQSIGQKFRELL